MAGIVLTRIDKGDCQIIRVNYICRRAARHDFAEDAFGDHNSALFGSTKGYRTVS
jgi:hypothetical protein